MACGKHSYRTRAEATKSIKGIHKHRATRSKQQPTQSYFCEECQAWHLSSNRKKPLKPVNDTVEVKRKRRTRPFLLNIQDFTSKPKK